MTDPVAAPGATDPAPSTRQPVRLSAEHADSVYSFARMVAATDADAEDLAQVALERAVHRINQYQPGRGELQAWLWGIVVNAARDAGRAERRRLAVLSRLRWQHRTAATPDDDIPLGVTDLRLLKAVRELSSRQRAVVALRFGADLDHAAVGRALGISTGAARSACHRALTLLRQRLTEEHRDA